MPHKIEIILVDDHALVRQGFRRLLEDESDLAVVGEASTAADAIRLAKQSPPDVIVMDCALPDGGGLDATRKILEFAPQVSILMLSMHSEETLVRQALEAGALGYVLKSALDMELALAIRRVAAKETVLSPTLARASALKGERNAALSTRELEVLKWIVSGKSNKQIAEILDLSVNTVAVHRANIMGTLGVHKTAELIVYAIRNGLANMP
jgi:DNA-binding NarL/FixJ family response regulator